MKHLVAGVVITLGIATAALGGYAVGSITGTPIVVDQKFDTSQCNDIVLVKNAYTNKNDTICEITLKDSSADPSSGVVGTLHNVTFPLQGN